MLKSIAIHVVEMLWNTGAQAGQACAGVVGKSHVVHTIDSASREVVNTIHTQSTDVFPRIFSAFYRGGAMLVHIFHTPYNNYLIYKEGVL